MNTPLKRGLSLPLRIFALSGKTTARFAIRFTHPRIPGPFPIPKNTELGREEIKILHKSPSLWSAFLHREGFRVGQPCRTVLISIIFISDNEARLPLDCIPAVAHIREKAIEAPHIHTICSAVLCLFSIGKL